MRKIFKSFMLVAAAAMAFTSCQKEETAAPETVSATLTMHAGVEETKTYLGEGNKVLWGKGEAVKLYVGAGETAKFFDSASTDAYDGEASASFTFEIDGVTEADTYALGGIYPASAAEGINNNDNPKSYKVALPATQDAEPGKYDPSAYIMVLKPETVEALPSEYTASFRRAVALNKITLTNVKEDISSVEIIVPEKKFLAGRRYMNLTTGESGVVYESGTQTNVVKVNGDFKSGSFDVWFCSWGVELVEGDALTVKMTSANNTYTRTITTREEGIKFVEGNLNTLKINMASAEVEAISTIAGDYLIASKTSSGWFLMTPTNGGKFYSATTSISSSSTVTCADFYDVADVDNYVWNVAKYDNGYSIKSVNTNKYVTYSGSSNEAYANEELSNAAKMDIQLTDQSAVIESMNVSGRKLQYNASSPRFAFYTTAQTGVYLIPWIPDTTPRITLTKNSDEVAYDATSYDFTYTTKNITGNVAATIKDGATMTNVSASASNGTVTVKFDANDDAEQKTATIILSYEGAVSQEFVLTQAGKSATVEAGWVSTSFANLKEGDQVVIVGTKSSVTYAMSNDKGTSNPPIPVEVSISGDKLTSEPATNIVWHVGVDGKNRIFNADANGAKWLYCTSSNNGVRVGTNTAKAFAFENNYLKHVGTNRYLGIYLTQDWRCYTSHTATNIANQTFQFFVKSGDAGGETPEPDPTPDPEPEEPGEGGGENPELGSTTVTLSGDDLGAASTTSKSMDSVISFANSAANTYSNPMRLYANTTFTITSQGKDITKVVFTCNSGKPTDGCVKGTVSLDAGASYTVEASDYVVTFTITGSTKKFALKASEQYRIDALAVTYKN